jgi:pilus assembly protein CpaB
MNLRVIVPILLAVFIALVGSFLTYRWVKLQVQPSPEAPERAADTVSIAVAAVDLPWGKQLAREDLLEERYLKDSLPPGCFTSLEKVQGRVLVFPIKANEPVLESRLAPITIETGGVAAIVEPGKRAIAVKGDKVIGLSGLIRPGNMVDVLVTVKDPGKKRQVTKLVLQNIPVLATGQQLNEGGKGEASPVDVYTLEVTPEEGEKLALADAQGKLQLALRNAMDTETVLTKGATVKDTLASYRYAAKRSKRRSPSVPYVSKVQVIKGNKVSEKSFSQ